MSSYTFLLLIASAAHHVSSTPPSIAQKSSNHLLYSDKKTKVDEAASNSSHDALHGGKRFNQLGMMGVAGSKYAVWILILLEILAHLLSISPNSSLSTTLLPILLPGKWFNLYHSNIHIQTYPHSLVPIFDVSPPTKFFWFCISSILIGYAIRRECFRVMGRHFSFTHTTLENHQLITEGPYSIVRHPSYTGEVLVRGGTALLLLRPGGFVAQCGALSTAHFLSFTDSGFSLPQLMLLTSVRICLAFYVGWILFGCSFLIYRAPLEDKTLHETFGKTWEEYSKRVPYRFFPLVA